MPKQFKLCKILASCMFLLTFSSCSAVNSNIEKAYLNCKYVLTRAGDLHGLAPTSNEVLDRNPGFTNYLNCFNKEESYIDFQCKGTSYKDFYCEASFKLVDANSLIVVEKETFRCSYTGGQSGIVIYDDIDAKELLGPIYVYTPYWCRWQFEYDVGGDGEKVLLTFEFWKNTYHTLPDFVNGDE